MFGKGSQAALLELVRLTIPRRLFTNAQLRYAAEAVIEVAAHAETLSGLRMTYQPQYLRHFTARFAPFGAVVVNPRIGADVNDEMTVLAHNVAETIKC